MILLDEPTGVPSVDGAPAVARAAVAEATDGDLLLAVADQDRRAFEELFRRHAAWLTVRLRYRCPDAALVDDVVQETFLAVWRGSARFPEESDAAAAWLWTVASRRLVDAVRGHGARARLARRLQLWRSADEPSAEEIVLRAVEHGELAGALARLPAELRAVLQATVLDGLTTGEAAALLGIPAGTVKTRLMRARRRLREELG